MLIRCNSCQKLFDYQQCKGVCPGCGQQQNAPVPAASPSSHTSQSSHMIPKVLLALWAAILVVALVGRQVSLHRWKNSGMLEGEVPASQLQAEEFSLRGRAGEIGSCERMGAQYTTGLETGHQLVRVKLVIQEPLDFDSGLSDAVFLQTTGPDGPQYYAPANRYDLERIYPQLSGDILNDFCLTSYGEVDGYLYFVIPQDAKEPVLYLELAHGHSRSQDERILEKVLLCPLKMTDAAVKSEVTDDE